MSNRFISRATRYACRTLRNAGRYGRDAAFGTYTNHTPASITRLTAPLPLHTIEPHREALLALANLALAHRFDLLGSGWVQLTPRSTKPTCRIGREVKPFAP